MSRQIIGSGQYIITSKGNDILEAYLGTCVGVALWDRSAGLGGLIHLLLPEPISKGSPFDPMLYAKTGLPAFISELCREGAARERLEACVAGGALIGPVCERDLILNIGGRTADEVERILHLEGIPIRKSEIGGYFGYRLSLNTASWETRIEPSSEISIPGLTDDSFKRPKREELRMVMERLLPVPQIALKIIRMINDPECTTSDIASEISKDQVLSARVIRFCNSAFLWLLQKVDSLERALVILGDKKILQLAVSASFSDFLTQNEKGYSLCKGGLFKHALGTALIAGKLAELSRKAPADLAYTAGLLHDIGKVVLDQFMAPVYPLFYRSIHAESASVLEREQAFFGLSHTEAGSRLATHWRLPQTLKETIECHHNPGAASCNGEVTHMVYLADLIMSRFMAGLEIERMDTGMIHSSLEAISFRTEQLPHLVEIALCELSRNSILRIF